MKKLIILTGLLLSASAYVQAEVTAGVTRGKDHGVIYALLKTAVDIEVKANKVTYTPGELSKYADRYLRLTDMSGEPQEYWELVSVKAKSVGIPDSDHTYFVKLKDKTVAPLTELTEGGIVKSINVPLDPKRSAPIQPATTLKKKVNPRDFLTEEILMAGSTVKMAELVTREIYNIRESKNTLVRGQADGMSKDGEQLRIMLASLEEQEAAMTEMFSGTLNKDERIFTIRLNPEKEMDNEMAFHFSRKLGIVANNDLAGEPVYITLKNLKIVNVPEDNGKKKADGIACNAPGKAQVVLIEGKKKWFNGELPVTQFGTIEYLAPALFNKRSTVQVTSNPATGGLIKVDREKGE